MSINKAICFLLFFFSLFSAQEEWVVLEEKEINAILKSTYVEKFPEKFFSIQKKVKELSWIYQQKIFFLRNKFFQNIFSLFNTNNKNKILFKLTSLLSSSGTSNSLKFHIALFIASVDNIHEHVFQELIKNLHHSQSSCRYWSLWILKQHRKQIPISDLASLLQDKNYKIVFETLHFVKEQGNQAYLLVPDLNKLLKKIYHQSFSFQNISDSSSIHPKILVKEIVSTIGKIQNEEGCPIEFFLQDYYFSENIIKISFVNSQKLIPKFRNRLKNKEHFIHFRKNLFALGLLIGLHHDTSQELSIKNIQMLNNIYPSTIDINNVTNGSIYFAGYLIGQARRYPKNQILLLKNALQTENFEIKEIILQELENIGKKTIELEPILLKLLYNLRDKNQKKAFYTHRILVAKTLYHLNQNKKAFEFLCHALDQEEEIQKKAIQAIATLQHHSIPFVTKLLDVLKRKSCTSLKPLPTSIKNEIVFTIEKLTGRF